MMRAMGSMARLLRAELIPRRVKWVPNALGAALAGAAAYVCLRRPSDGMWTWGVPFAMIALKLGSEIAGAITRRVAVCRAIRRTRVGGCVRCGYDLRHIHSQRCPECGAPFIARQSTRRHPEPNPST